MQPTACTSESASILVVDDQPANLHVLTDILKARQYRVRPVPSGSLALSAAEHDPPDLVLLDITMPEMDGYEVCRRLKAHPVLQRIPVIFISALDEIADKLQGFRVGGVDYVTKPFQVEEVLARVETHLAMERMRRELESYSHRLEFLVEEKVREISNSQLATIVAVSKLTECRDDDTGQHIERTRSFCRMIAEELQRSPGYGEGVNDQFIETIFCVAPLHDIGKVGIPDAILLKPGKHTPEEFEVMKTHVTIGAETLQTVLDQYPQHALVRMGIDVARAHHEKWDGSGYPDSLAAEAIPLSARIMALADVYDALRSTRPYKRAFNHAESRKIIVEGSGKHFDPAVVQAFLVREAEVVRMYEQMGSE